MERNLRCDIPYTTECEYNFVLHVKRIELICKICIDSTNTYDFFYHRLYKLSKLLASISRGIGIILSNLSICSLQISKSNFIAKLEKLAICGFQVTPFESR